MTLNARQLTRRINGHTLLHDVSLDIRPGENLALIGPNGSGKTTLLRLLAGLQAPCAGRVLLQDRPMHHMRRKDIARRLAMVEQQAMAIDRISVREAVSLGRTPFLSPLQGWSNADETLVEQAMQDVGIDTLADRLWHTLSGGEAQRVQIARALAQQPEVLLLDEPTNHLDIRHQLSILSLVRALPVTVVIALHDLDQAMAFDRVGVMEDGRLVDLGRPEAVLTPDRLRHTFGVDAHCLEDPVHGRFMRFMPLGASSSTPHVQTL